MEVRKTQDGTGAGDMLPRLDALFIELFLIHDLMLVCCEAAKSVGSDIDGELANVLQHLGADPLYTHLKTLSTVIEQMGGQTNLTEH